MISTVLEVVQGDLALGTRECTLRRLPDGSIGALCQGLVFPLLPGPRIDLAGAWSYPDECPVLMSVPPELDAVFNGAGGDWWHLDLSGYYPYVMMEPGEPILGLAANALSTAGFEVSRAGVSFRAADNGRHYPFFISLEPDPEQSLTRLAVAQALASVRPTRRNDGDPPPLDARGDAATWRLRAIEAERTLARVEDELGAARQRLDETLAASHRTQQSLKDEIALLRAAIEAYRVQLDTLERGRVTVAEDMAALGQMLREEPRPSTERDAQLRQLEADLETALQSWQEALNRADQAQSRFTDFENRIAVLEHELSQAREGADALDIRPPVPSSGLRSRVDDLQVTLRGLLPDLRFQFGSVDFMATEVFDWRDLFDDLHTLQNRPGTLAAKKVQSTDGWLERHFNTGRSNDGRLYFRHRNGACEVLVSDKHAQPRDIERLKRI